MTDCLIIGCGRLDYDESSPDGRRLVPNEAAEGSLICSHHESEIRLALAEIPELWSYLPLVMEPGSVQTDASGVGGKRTEAPSPVRLDVLSVMDSRTTIRGQGDGLRDVLGTLRIIADAIREERRLDPPKEARRFVVTPGGRVYVSTRVEVSVESEARLIERHLLWLLRQEWIDDAYDDVTSVHRQLQQLTGVTAGDAVGDCYMKRGACPGKVIPADVGYRCTVCGTRWRTPKTIAVLTLELQMAL